MTSSNNLTGEEVAAKLDEARALIERGWTQGHYAIDVDDTPVLETATAAVCWCASGALWAVAGDDTELFWKMHRVFHMATGEREIPRWNDASERTQSEAIEAFRKAAELARSGDA